MRGSIARPRRWTAGSDDPLSRPEERNRRDQPRAEHSSGRCSRARDSALGEGRGFGTSWSNFNPPKISLRSRIVCFHAFRNQSPCSTELFMSPTRVVHRLVRVGGFALDSPDQPREFALGEGLVGQAAIERRPLVLPANEGDHVCVSTGMGTSLPRTTLLFMPVVNQDVAIGGTRAGTGLITIRAPAGLARCTDAGSSLNVKILSGKYQDQRASRAHPSPG